MLIGEQGSAKTTLINSFFKKYKSDEHVVMNSNFSSTTTPQLFQKSVESSVDKRMGNVYGPPAGGLVTFKVIIASLNLKYIDGFIYQICSHSGKHMTIFVDDVNLPEINEWGDQVTNEFFR